MKTKFITIAAIVVAAIGLFSFKTMQQSDTATVATVSLVMGKGENEGYLISYSDGTSEIKPLKWKMTAESGIEQQMMASQVMGYLHAKGFRYVSMGSTPMAAFMVFEKK